jgi:hypothetical protein
MLNVYQAARSESRKRLLQALAMNLVVVFKAYACVIGFTRALLGLALQPRPCCLQYTKLNQYNPTNCTAKNKFLLGTQFLPLSGGVGAEVHDASRIMQVESVAQRCEEELKDNRYSIVEYEKSSSSFSSTSDKILLPGFT